MYNLTYIFVPTLDPRCCHGFVAVSNRDWLHRPHWYSSSLYWTADHCTYTITLVGVALFHVAAEHAGKLTN